MTAPKRLMDTPLRRENRKTQSAYAAPVGSSMRIAIRTQNDFLQRLLCQRSQPMIRMLQRQTTGNRIRDRNAKNPGRLCCSDSVGRIFQRNRFVGGDAEIFEYL